MAVAESVANRSPNEAWGTTIEGASRPVRPVPVLEPAAPRFDSLLDYAQHELVVRGERAAVGVVADMVRHGAQGRPGMFDGLPRGFDAALAVRR
ncbi:MAG: hypothetical protein CMJ18_19210 [Phycisphaeraceae bacterium]|nr:hypothetical protein [Phycisphaeraceae bacterium]